MPDNSSDNSLNNDTTSSTTVIAEAPEAPEAHEVTDATEASSFISIEGSPNVQSHQQAFIELKTTIAESGLIFASYLPTVGQYITFGYLLSQLGSRAIEAAQSTSVTSIVGITVLLGPVMYSLNMMSDLNGAIQKLISRRQSSQNQTEITDLAIQIENKQAEFKRVFWTTNIYSIISNLIITVPSYALAELYLPYFVSRDIASTAGDFLLTGSLFILPWALQNVTTNLLITNNKSKILFVSNVATAIVAYSIGAILSLGLLAAPKLGLKGIAVGQVLASWVNIAAVYAYCYKYCNQSNLFTKDFYKFHNRQVLKTLIKKGSFISLIEIGERFNIFFLTFYYASLGSMVAIASNTSLQILNIYSPLFLGVTMAANNFISYYNGKLEGPQKDRWLNAMSYTKIVIGAGIGGLAAGFCYSFPDQIINFFGSDIQDNNSSLESSQSVTLTAVPGQLSQISQVTLAKEMLNLAAISIIFDSIAKVCISVSRARDNSVVIPFVINTFITNLVPMMLFAYDKISSNSLRSDDIETSIFYMQLRTYSIVAVAVLLFVIQINGVSQKIAGTCSNLTTAVQGGITRLRDYFATKSEAVTEQLPMQHEPHCVTVNSHCSAREHTAP